MQEALDRARITPLNWWVGHPRDGHIEVKARAEDPQGAQDNHVKPLAQEAFGLGHQPTTGNKGTHSDRVENQEQPGLCEVGKNLMADIQGDQIIKQVDDKIAKKHIATKARISGSDGNLNPYGRNNEALVIGEADAKHEERPISVAHLVRGVDPTEEKNQNQHEG